MRSEHLRLIAKVGAKKAAAEDFAEAQRIAAEAEARATVIHSEVAAKRYAVDAEGQSKANEADNLLSVEARTSRARMRLLDKIEPEAISAVCFSFREAILRKLIFR
jgi:hypothetical protein